MIFSTNEPPQYIVVLPTGCEIKDISYIAIKQKDQDFKSGGLFKENANICYLLSICNNTSDLKFKIPK